MTAEYPDLVSTLNEVRRQVESDKQIWCIAGNTFETTVSPSRALLLGGVWCPQLLRDESNPWLVAIENPRLLAIDTVAGPIPEWLPLLEGVANNHESLLIATRAIEDQHLAMLMVNSSKGALPSCVVRAGEGPLGSAASEVKPPRDSRRLPQARRAFCRRDATAVFFDDNSAAGGQTTVKMISVGGEHAADQLARVAYLSRLLARGR